MRGRKVYGHSRTDTCPFCGKQSLTSNSEGIPVCIAHKNEKLPEMKCACGSWLDLRKGKFGVFFTCINCGTVNFNKGMEMNPDLTKKPEPTERTVTSDEVDFI